jgi:hypothetical protein
LKCNKTNHACLGSQMPVGHDRFHVDHDKEHFRRYLQVQQEQKQDVKK